jgi:hypothetical protein
MKRRRIGGTLRKKEEKKLGVSDEVRDEHTMTINRLLDEKDSKMPAIASNLTTVCVCRGNNDSSPVRVLYEIR